jgi:hypothetical protein
MNKAIMKRLEKSEQAADALPEKHEMTREEYHASLLDIGVSLEMLGCTPEEIERAKATPVPKRPPTKPMSNEEFDAKMREYGIEV